MTMPNTWYLPCPKEDSFEAIGAIIEGQGNTNTEPGLLQLMSNDAARAGELKDQKKCTESAEHCWTNQVDQYRVQCNEGQAQIPAAQNRKSYAVLCSP